jgi:hypothetical protein
METVASCDKGEVQNRGWDGRASSQEEDGLEVDIDSDDEKRGKGKKVSTVAGVWRTH